MWSMFLKKTHITIVLKKFHLKIIYLIYAVFLKKFLD